MSIWFGSPPAQRWSAPYVGPTVCLERVPFFHEPMLETAESTAYERMLGRARESLMQFLRDELGAECGAPAGECELRIGVNTGFAYHRDVTLFGFRSLIVLLGTPAAGAVPTLLSGDRDDALTPDKLAAQRGRPAPVENDGLLEEPESDEEGGGGDPTACQQNPSKSDSCPGGLLSGVYLDASRCHSAPPFDEWQTEFGEPTRRRFVGNCTFKLRAGDFTAADERAAVMAWAASMREPGAKRKARDQLAGR